MIPVSLHSAVAGFNSTFAVRLGADEQQMGLLSSCQALIGLLLRLPFATFLERRTNPARWMFGSLLLLRIMYLGPALIPLLFPESAGVALVIWLVILQVPAVFFNAGWASLLLELIKPQDRARILANRSVIHSGLIIVISWFFGQLLEWRSDIFPANFQWLYVAGVSTLMISSYMLTKLAIPKTFLNPAAAAQQDDANAPELDTSFRAILSEVRTNKNFLRLLFDTLAYQGGVWLLTPLFPIYFVDQLGATDVWIGNRLAAMQIGTIAGYMIWRRVMDRKGFSWTLKLTVPFGALFAITAGLVPDLTVILIMSGFHNFIVPGFGLSRSNVLYKLCPTERRPTYLGLWNTALSLGQVVLPLIGVAISNMIGIRQTLILGGSLRLLGMVSYYVLPVEEPEQDLSIARPG